MKIVLLAFLIFSAPAFAGELEEISQNLPSTPDRIAKGKSLYIGVCLSCHGPAGQGDGPAAVAFNPKPRNFTAEKFKQGASPAAVFQTISTGLGSMPSFASLPIPDRMALVHYVLSLSPNKMDDTPETLAKIGLDPTGQPLAGFVGAVHERPLPVTFIMERMAVDGNVASLNIAEAAKKMSDEEAEDKAWEQAQAEKAVIKPDLKRGGDIFESCQICHGSNGAGTSLAKAPQLAGQDVDYIITQLKHFQNGVRGAHAADVDGLRMRPMSRLLKSEEDIVNVAHYAANLPPIPPVPTMEGDSTKGQAAFGTCMACHGPDAKGVKVMGAPSLRYLQDWYVAGQIQKFKAGHRAYDPRDTGGATMKGMAMAVDEQMVKDIMAYIGTLK
ncbi:MAG: c-type cytochrome [Deltaproteobacteria bacterium]|nr:c-type cytochrome [Deltaproteobacteria bacterium]